ncbi:MAG TPA: Rv3235 family protein [Streptosporangiaceae bacterium]|nr:Rv3235 family protein [Streptosporangiaceae bacterium]
MAWQFAQVIVEIMAGLRPPKQIIGLTTDHAREQARRLAPLLASDRRPGIRRILTSRPTARVVEMTVIVSVGPRSRALAMRLEHIAARPATPGRPARPDRWLCTAIEAG